MPCQLEKRHDIVPHPAEPRQQPAAGRAIIELQRETIVVGFAVEMKGQDILAAELPVAIGDHPAIVDLRPRGQVDAPPRPGEGRTDGQRVDPQMIDPHIEIGQDGFVRTGRRQVRRAQQETPVQCQVADIEPSTKSQHQPQRGQRPPAEIGIGHGHEPPVRVGQDHLTQLRAAEQRPVDPPDTDHQPALQPQRGDPVGDQPMPQWGIEHGKAQHDKRRQPHQRERRHPP